MAFRANRHPQTPPVARPCDRSVPHRTGRLAPSKSIAGILCQPSRLSLCHRAESEKCAKGVQKTSRTSSLGATSTPSRNRINKTGHLDGQRRTRDIVQTTEILRVAQIESEFLAGFALSRVFEIWIIRFGCATGKSNMPRPRILGMCGTLDKEKIEIIPSRMKNRSNSRLRLIRSKRVLG